MTKIINEIEAEIKISPARKLGYITNPETSEDFEIQTNRLNHALHGDKVKVRLLNEIIREKKQAEVVEILSRIKTKFIGTVKNEESDSECFVVADNQKMYVDIHLDKGECYKTKKNDKVFVEIIKWDKNKDNPEGKILEVVGQKGVHEVEMRAIVLDRGFDLDFPKVILEEAKQAKNKWSPIPKNEIEKRKDFRNVTTFTIDPEDAKDFDDALSVKKLDNGNYEIGVHIADVSHFVTPNTELDKESFERAFSVYLVDRTIPMLPEILSNDLCSLNPNEDKLSFSAVFELNANAEVKNEWFGKTIINSDKRFTYERAQEVLDNQSGEFLEELNILDDLSKKLSKRKIDAGAIRFEREEYKFELDEKGVPLRIYKKPSLWTHKLIEEFMLLANKSVAKYIFDFCKEKNNSICDLMYRVHGIPEQDKIQELRIFLKAMGYILPLQKDGSITPKDINALLAQVSGKAEESLITTATIRTMSKAVYSTSNSGHFGLAFEYYTHFTSPIRRYPDLVVHRILNSFLENKKIDSKEIDSFRKVAEHSTNQEIAAQDAERNSIRYKQVEFMQNHVGEEFKGIISGVAPFGIFIVLDDTGAEGMVHISKLGNDFFNLDEKNYRIVGEKTGKKFSLGDPIKVKIESANLDDRKLEMSLV